MLKLKAQLAALVAASQAHVAAQEADGLRHRAALADLHRRCVDAEAPQLALRYGNRSSLGAARAHMYVCLCVSVDKGVERFS